jgi:hypothetical protein
MPQYRFAYNSDQEVIDVLELPSDREELSDQYICFGCDNPLIAKTRGEKREKHFAHKNRLSCNEETYLHRLAKMTFYRTYLDCLENNEKFLIDLTYTKVCRKYEQIVGHSCNRGSLSKTHDLTIFYDSINLETRDDSFIPDLLLYNSKNADQKLYIEIAVTHFLSDEKILSENRIIEIPIETEDDIAKILSKRLTESDVSFINFDRPSGSVTDAECTCAQKKYYYFIIYDSGKCIVDDTTIREIESKIRKVSSAAKYIKLRYFSDSDHIDRGWLFKDFVEEARKSGFPLKNCLLCRMAGPNFNTFSDDKIFCKKKRVGCNSNAAADCKNFWLGEEYGKAAA